MIIGKHHRHRAAFDGDIRFIGELPWLWGAENEQAIILQHVDVITVGLDEVSLIYPFLLIIGT